MILSSSTPVSATPTKLLPEGRLVLVDRHRGTFKFLTSALRFLVSKRLSSVHTATERLCTTLLVYWHVLTTFPRSWLLFKIHYSSYIYAKKTRNKKPWAYNLVRFFGKVFFSCNPEQKLNYNPSGSEAIYFCTIYISSNWNLGWL